MIKASPIYYNKYKMKVWMKEAIMKVNIKEEELEYF